MESQTCQSLFVDLKQVLDIRHRPGSRWGCPLVNLSSPWHTVEAQLGLGWFTRCGEWWAGTWADSSCSVSGRHCSNGWEEEVIFRVGGQKAPLETVQGKRNSSQQSLPYSTVQGRDVGWGCSLSICWVSLHRVDANANWTGYRRLVSPLLVFGERVHVLGVGSVGSVSVRSWWVRLCMWEVWESVWVGGSVYEEV